MQSLKKQNNIDHEKKFFDEWATSISFGKINPFLQFEVVTAPENKEIIKILGDIKGKKVLILGCGLGEEAIYLASQGARVTAIDVSEKLLKIVHKLALKHNLSNNLELYCMSTEDIRFPKDTFDVVLGCNILHHVDIEKTTRETKRVLKPEGVGVFSEPLAHNPLINIYRMISKKTRTINEHPLRNKDLETIRNHFPILKHKEFHLLTLSIFIWFYLVERIDPNKVRYWKKRIDEAEKYKKAFNLLYTLDRIVLGLFPFFRRYCWITVIKINK